MSQSTAFILELIPNINKLVTVYHVLNKFNPKKEKLILFFILLDNDKFVLIKN